VKLIESAQNSLVKHLVRVVRSAQYRREHQVILIEGQTLIREICAQHPANIILTSDEALIPSNIQTQASYLCNEAIIKKISTLKEPEGIVAEIPMPQPSDLSNADKILVLDGLSDPGNVGTLLRSAIAFAWDGVFFLPGSCDPFNDKVLRASRAALYQLPYANGTWEDLEKISQKKQTTKLVADLSGQHPKTFMHSKRYFLVLGNEARGPSQEVKNSCQAVTIPMSEAMESLNVATAGGILMYLLNNGESADGI